MGDIGNRGEKTTTRQEKLERYGLSGNKELTWPGNRQVGFSITQPKMARILCDKRQRGSLVMSTT